MLQGLTYPIASWPMASKTSSWANGFNHVSFHNLYQQMEKYRVLEVWHVKIFGNVKLSCRLNVNCLLSHQASCCQLDHWEQLSVKFDQNVEKNHDKTIKNVVFRPFILFSTHCVNTEANPHAQSSISYCMNMFSNHNINRGFSVWQLSSQFSYNLNYLTTTSV